MAGELDTDVTLYVRLLDEGTDVARPCQAWTLSGASYILVSPTDFDPEVENWEFKPGTFVTAERRTGRTGEYLLATSEVESSPSLVFAAFRELRKRTGAVSVEDLLKARDEGRR